MNLLILTLEHLVLGLHQPGLMEFAVQIKISAITDHHLVRLLCRAAGAGHLPRLRRLGVVMIWKLLPIKAVLLVWEVLGVALSAVRQRLVYDALKRHDLRSISLLWEPWGIQIARLMVFNFQERISMFTKALGSALYNRMLLSILDRAVRWNWTLLTWVILWKPDGCIKVRLSHSLGCGIELETHLIGSPVMLLLQGFLLNLEFLYGLAVAVQGHLDWRVPKALLLHSLRRTLLLLMKHRSLCPNVYCRFSMAGVESLDACWRSTHNIAGWR